MNIGTQFSRTWIIREAPIYRYMSKQFVDAFFEMGALRVSSFNTFRQHPEEALKDDHEGSMMFATDFKGKTFGTYVHFAGTFYVLCGSRECSKRLHSKYKTDAIIKINDPYNFATTISSYIPGFSVGLTGDCIYKENPFIRNVGSDEFARAAEGMLIGPNGPTVEQITALAERQWTDDAYFVKREKEYRDDWEARMLWKVPRCERFIDIVCPEARQFCERAEPSF